MAEVTLATSNLCLPKWVLASGSTRAHQSFLEQAGYRAGFERKKGVYVGGGFELSEVRSFIGGVAARNLIDGDVASLHQSWQSTRWSEIGGVMKRSGLAGLLAMAAIPPIDGSLERLDQLQKHRHGRSLSVVAHPNEQQPPGEKPRFNFDYKHLARPFSGLRYQPTAEVLHAWGVLDDGPDQVAGRIIAAQRSRGFDGVALDTSHLGERHGLSVGDSEALVRALGHSGTLHEIQINFTGRPIELSGVLNHGLGMVPDGRLLRAALESIPSGQQQLLVVTEVAPTDFRSVGMRSVVQGHQKLIDAIADVLPAAA